MEIQMGLPTVLLVDDIKLFLEVERGFLQESAICIQTAENGREALDLIGNKRPDLIYLDQRMPVMDGTTCCAVIKADPVLKDVPVIMIIASTREEDITECHKAGCDEILFKPIDRKIFLDTGRKFLPLIDRREKRISCRTQVILCIGEQVFYSTSKDVSEHGMFVAFDHPVNMDDTLMVSFVLPGGRSILIEALGRIAWVNAAPNAAYPPGFGMEFLQITEESCRHIQDFIAASR